ncbi:MAG: MFS transporter, partial [Actinobacteria bacterium]|nr:MFS transporter [Actinomycetota bacterium]
MMGVFFTIPIFLQTVLGFSALKAGAVMSPMSVAVMIAAPLAGRLSDRLGSRWLITAGMLLLALGIAWMAGLNPSGQGLQPSTGVGDLLLPFMLAGLGIGMAIAPTTSAVMATAPPDRVGNASGVLSTVRQLGSLMGIAVLGAVLQNRLAYNVETGVDAIPGLPAPVKRMIIDGVAEGAGPMSPPAGADEQTGAMAESFATLFQGWFTEVVNTTFVVAAVVCLVGAA